MTPAIRPLLGKLGLEPDPWQIEVLQGKHARLLLNCCRQAGKSTVVALLALLEALFEPFTQVLIVSRSLRQATELFRRVNFFHYLLGERLKAKRNATELLLDNNSRILCLPCREDTIRGFSAVSLMVIDEAARVPDNLYRAMRPMLAVSEGRIVCLSTPYGKRGFFWREWAHGGEDWHRIEVPAPQVARISPAFLEAERRSLGEAWFRQEYLCSFEAQEGLVFPDLGRCVVERLPAGLPDAPPCRPASSRYTDPPSGLVWVGGLDFGFRNPFAALWGVLDREDVLWLVGEHYAAGQPLSVHAARLSREVVWYADPAGAADRAELRRAGFCVKQGVNAIRPGIAAVTARIQSGRLKVLRGRCPNLLREADLYRYPSLERDADGDVGGVALSSENPIDAHNHALAALRYLIARIDQHKQIPAPALPAAEPPAPLLLDDDDSPHWQPI